jgi:hypothetical protein
VAVLGVVQAVDHVGVVDGLASCVHAYGRMREAGRTAPARSAPEEERIAG